MDSPEFLYVQRGTRLSYESRDLANGRVKRVEQCQLAQCPK